MIIGFVHLFYNKCNNLAFETNNKILNILLWEVFFLAIDEIAKNYETLNAIFG